MTVSSGRPPRSIIDRALLDLRDYRYAWLAVSLSDRIGYPRNLMSRYSAVKSDMVDEASTAKVVGKDLAGKDSVAGPVAFLRTARFLADTLEGIRRTGRVPLARCHIAVRPGDR